MPTSTHFVCKNLEWADVGIRPYKRYKKLQKMRKIMKISLYFWKNLW